MRFYDLAKSALCTLVVQQRGSRARRVPKHHLPRWFQRFHALLAASPHVTPGAGLFVNNEHPYELFMSQMFGEAQVVGESMIKD